MVALRALAEALERGRDALDSGRERTRGGERALIDELIEWLGQDAAGTALGTWLAEFAGADEDRRATLADVAGLAARQLARDASTPPGTAETQALEALSIAVDRLYGAGAHPLGRLPFMTDALLARLVAEAREALPERPDEGRQIAAGAGTALARLR